MTVMVAPVAEAEAEWETVVEAPTAGAVAKGGTRWHRGRLWLLARAVSRTLFVLFH